jgi:hypothetical protein
MWLELAVAFSKMEPFKMMTLLKTPTPCSILANNTENIEADFARKSPKDVRSLGLFV